MKVHLYGKLRRFAESKDPAKESVVDVEVDPEETIEQVAERIGIPREELGSNIFLDGEYSDLRRPVGNAERLGLFPDDMQLLYSWHFDKKR